MTQLWGLRRWLCATLGIGLLIALANVGLVACGYANPTQSGSSSPASQAQGNQTLAQGTQTPVQGLATRPPTQAPVQAQVQKCGFVHGYEALKLVPQNFGSEQVENCFWQAYQHCRPATLVFITGGPRSTLIHTFTIRNGNGSCLIVDAKQLSTTSNSSAPATIYFCRGLKLFPHALNVLDCGQEGTVEVLGS